jgi:demethylmenaquinone methyltransferase/2-methoxy-6-polyprenyl-1,4-benzoquinol methylase
MNAQLQGKEKSDYVQEMFGRVARRYDIMNRVMTGWQDLRWRKFVVKKAALPEKGALLDLATGTGDIAFETLKVTPSATVIGADFSLPMMFVGQTREQGDVVRWSGADALHLPFPNTSFDAVTSGYLLRNVIDIPQTLREQFRVLKSGGKIVVLDSSPPPKNILRPFIMIHLRYIIPILGRIIVGKEAADAYRYLPESTQAFKTPQELVALLEGAGFVDVGYQSFMFGTMCVHWGKKP